MRRITTQSALVENFLLVSSVIFKLEVTSPICATVLTAIIAP